MKKILKEQILNGSCATATYLYPNPGDAYESVEFIKNNYGPNAYFSDYYSVRPNQPTPGPGWCLDQNGDPLGKDTFINASSNQGGIYTGQVVQADTWKNFIDQINMVHQANNIPIQATTSMNWTVSSGGAPHAVTQSGIIRTFFQVGGSLCLGCPDPIEPPTYGCIDQIAINYNPNANTDDGSCEYRYNCVDNQCVKAANGSFSSVIECKKSPCGPTTKKPEIKITTTTTDIEKPTPTELNCKHTPEEGCWACHSNPQAGGSCWQPPQNWIDTYGTSLGHDYYNTEAECITAGPLCKQDGSGNNKHTDELALDKEAISEDIQRMKRLIRY